MSEFDFDKQSADRIEKVINNYPMNLKSCADILELVAPLCKFWTAEGLLYYIKQSFSDVFNFINDK